VVLIFDDAYEGYVYDDDRLQRSPFIDFVNQDPRILPIKLDGISKEILFYGGRLGFMTFGIPKQWVEKSEMTAIQADLENKISGLVRSSVSNCPRVVQSLTLMALENQDALVAQRQRVINVLTKRVLAFREALANVTIPNLETDPFQAGFFAFMNLKNIVPADLAEVLMSRYATGVVPLDKGTMKGIRVAFCSVPEKDIPALVSNIAKACADLSK
ncbi:MAG TPA: aminotransferase class I/II-fold pyridoxal phosphate-dependent enzyme, partial [bacterium]|nr:aminotransferase class I/II-fold pyridoxal phosphate-dependent enzyme [bacterium]